MVEAASQGGSGCVRRAGRAVATDAGPEQGRRLCTAAPGRTLPEMRHLPTILLVMALPAGALGYALGVWLMSALPLPEDAQGFLVLIVPLFVAGLCMLPFLVPFIDRKARQDLAAHARSQGSAANDDDGPSGRG